ERRSSANFRVKENTMTMDLFIPSNATQALAHLTSVYNTLLTKVQEVSALFDAQKACLGRVVPVGHQLRIARERELEVAELRLELAVREMFPLIEPVRLAHLGLENEIPELESRTNNRTVKIAKNAVICARDLYEQAASLYYQIDLRQRDCCSAIG